MPDMVRVPGGAPRMQYQAPQMRLGRSQFDLSHNHKTTFYASRLVPYFVTEVLPGDTMTCKLMSFLRIFAPLQAPIMDNIEASIDFFFVPNRLVWEHWEEFLGASATAGPQTTDYTVPVLGAGNVINPHTLASYMGLPIGLDTSVTEVSSLPFRAFYLIYNEWYRDQNLIDEVTVPLGDTGAPFGVNSAPPRSAKKHDYFTSALPWLQKGDASGFLVTGTAPIATEAELSSDVLTVVRASTGGPYSMGADTVNVELGGSAGVGTYPLYADLGLGSVTVPINALREAAAIQRLLERDARGGTRHPELIRAHFGVDVPDHRTQRPEYLGGGRGFINVSPVAQTSSEGGTERVGTLAGVGTGTLRASWAKSFVEHGHVIGILRARGEVSYQQGLERMWSRQTRYDFMWPELAHLGEQAILNKELFVSNLPNTDDAVFGYQERYAEYRYKKSLVTGKFASDATGSLDFWHLSEDFASVPTLNQTFIEDQTPMARVTAVAGEPDFIIDGRFDLKVARALPVRPVPTLGPARF